MVLGRARTTRVEDDNGNFVRMNYYVNTGQLNYQCLLLTVGTSPGLACIDI